MKKILISLMAILLAVGVVGAGAMAYFSDTETSAGNTLTAGTLDLKVGGSTFEDDPNVKHVTLTNVKPDDTIYLYWTLKNVGTVPGQPSIKFANIVNYENGQNEPEALIDATSGDLQGELGSFLYVLMKWRQGAGAWQEIKMVMYGHTKLDNLSGPYGLGENGGPPIPVLNQNDEVEIQLRPWWDGRYSTPADNKAQSDSVEFDVIFQLNQVP